jgi:hypothetical protein
VVAEFALKKGHSVRGLARSEASAEKLRAKGVDPVIGDLHTLDVLAEEAKKADAGRSPALFLLTLRNLKGSEPGVGKMKHWNHIEVLEKSRYTASDTLDCPES